MCMNIKFSHVPMICRKSKLMKLQLYFAWENMPAASVEYSAMGMEIKDCSIVCDQISVCCTTYIIYIYIHIYILIMNRMPIISLQPFMNIVVSSPLSFYTMDGERTCTNWYTISTQFYMQYADVIANALAHHCCQSFHCSTFHDALSHLRLFCSWSSNYVKVSSEYVSHRMRGFTSWLLCLT